MTAKVSDMGLCAAVKHANRSAANSVRALSHVAPEVQRGGHADPCSDVFAFGILMWEVFTGQQAYRKLLDAEHLYEVRGIQGLWGTTEGLHTFCAYQFCFFTLHKDRVHCVGLRHACLHSKLLRSTAGVTKVLYAHVTHQRWQ